MKQLLYLMIFVNIVRTFVLPPPESVTVEMINNLPPGTLTPDFANQLPEGYIEKLSPEVKMMIPNNINNNNIDNEMKNNIGNVSENKGELEKQNILKNILNSKKNIDNTQGNTNSKNTIYESSAVKLYDGIVFSILILTSCVYIV